MMEEKENGAKVVELHPLLLLRELLGKLWAAVMIAIIVGACAYIYTTATFSPVYQTNTTFVVSSRTGATSVYSNLSAAKNTATAFSKVLNSDVMKKQIAEKLGTDSIPGTISTKVIEQTNLIEMQVTASTPRQAYLIAKTTLDNYSGLTSTVLNSVALDVLQKPTIPVSPINSSGARRTTILAAFVAGAAVAAYICGKALLRDTVKSVSEVESKLDMKLLATVYHERKTSANKKIKKSILITDPTTGFAFVETFKKLRTRVEYLLRKNDCKVLMVTSVMENEGKSTVAANLALAMNRKNKRVLLIDADMKKPALHKIMEYADEEYASITEYLSGKESLSRALLTDKKHRLGLLLGRHGTENSTELIKSKNMTALIEQARKNVDVVIIDTPPMAVSTDVECLAELADAAIMVVRQDMTPARVINDAVDALGNCGAKLIGCVFNNVLAVDLNEHYDYGGSGKYGYVRQGYGYARYGKYGKYGKYGYGKYGYGKYGYGKYGYGKYGYGKYGYGADPAEPQERLALDTSEDGRGFLEDNR